MFLSKIKTMVFLLLMSAVVFSAGQALALQVDINISLEDGVDLAAFDLDLSYDDTLLTFVGYTLTDELGSFDDIDGDGWGDEAEDWSWGDDGAGTVSLTAESYLLDLSGQSSDFTIATVYFSGDVAALSTVSLTYLDLVDSYGDSIASDAVSVAPVPEPTTMILLGSGIIGLAGMRRRFKNRK